MGAVTREASRANNQWFATLAGVVVAYKRVADRVPRPRSLTPTRRPGSTGIGVCALSAVGFRAVQVDRFRELPLLGIVRGLAPDDVEPLAETVIAAGLATLEITMNTPGAPALIGAMVATARGRLTIGAGTVLTVDDLEAALDAGATFVVMPTLATAVVERCVARAIPVFPGALTPQEIHAAWTAGATMVKVFPAGAFGPEYLREIKGPFADVALLACGGVTAQNLSTYLACGASAVAVGGSVFRRDWLAARSYPRIGAEIATLVAAVRAARGASA
jgi:2-dehydro-3-deoxyphosphogluconate aldolase/(4S)-4-hydroxy-2-oxoglutarate aldolase